MRERSKVNIWLMRVHVTSKYSESNNVIFTQNAITLFCAEIVIKVSGSCNERPYLSINLRSTFWYLSLIKIDL